VTPPRKLFVAGASGVCGRALVALADARRVPVVPHLRPRHAEAGTADSRAAIFDLADTQALLSVLGRCTTVLSLIGTMRKRFASGDTYETSDIGTTRQLCEAARQAGTIDHFVLLSSVGAGGVGAYLRAKGAAEAVVKESGLPWTLFRPSVLEGEGRKPPPGFGPLTRALGLARWQPITVAALAAAMLKAALDRAPLGEILEGRPLFALAEPAA
jgi:uncharacterized protein YbjT (DUF2867 family)